MSEEKPPEISKLDELNSILDEIKEQGNLSGSILSFRDGGLITENYGKEIDTNIFTAMCASIIEGAKGLGQTIGDRTFRKIMTELEDKSIIMVDCGEKAILTLIIEKNSTGGTLLNELDEYIQKIKDLL